MKKADVIKYFGGVKPLCEAMGMTRQALDQWPDVVNKARQWELEVISGGALLVDPRHINYKVFNDPHKKRRAKLYGGGK